MRAPAHSSPRRRRFRGVTLLEMMIVVAMVGVIAAIAVPNLTPLINANKLSGAAEEVAGFVDEARRLAFASGRCVRITRPNATTLLMQERTHADCVNLTNTAADWAPAVRTLRAPARVEYSLDFTAGASAIIFRPNGRLRNTSTTVDLANAANTAARVRVTHERVPNRTRAIIVTAFGRVCVREHRGTLPTLSAPGTCS